MTELRIASVYRASARSKTPHIPLLKHPLSTFLALLIAGSISACTEIQDPMLLQTPSPDSSYRTVPIGEAKDLLGQRLALPRYIPPHLVSPTVLQVGFQMGVPESAKLIYTSSGTPPADVEKLVIDEYFTPTDSRLPPPNHELVIRGVHVILKDRDQSVEATWNHSSITFFVRLIGTAPTREEAVRVIDSILQHLGLPSSSNPVVTPQG